MLSCNDYDLLVLDIMMPKVDGLTVLREFRAQGGTTPVILLTAKSEISDRVEGLDSGANDYLTKPFAAAELLARIRALTHTSPGLVKQSLSFGDLSLDAEASALRCGDEYQMREMLVTHPGAKLSTDQFMRKIWGGLADAETSVVWVNISNLRKKLARVGAHVKISAARNVGYYLEETAE